MKVLVAILALLIGTGFYACDSGESGDETTEEGESTEEATSQESEETPVVEETPSVEETPPVDETPTEVVPIEPTDEPPFENALGETGACPPLQTCCEALTAAAVVGTEALVQTCAATAESANDSACAAVHEQITVTFQTLGAEMPAACQ